jgi:hypothetical protein
MKEEEDEEGGGRRKMRRNWRQSIKIKKRKRPPAPIQ